jgi:SAM-dependent methyltransferase
VIAVASTLALTRTLHSADVTAADLPALAAAARPIETHFVGNTILTGPTDPRLACEARWSCIPFPPASRILAYETNANFVYACGDASESIFDVAPAANALTQSKWIRRFIDFTTGFYVVDDLVQPAATTAAVQWMIGCRSKPTIRGRQLRVGDRAEELVCETLWPAHPTFGMARGALAGEVGNYVCTLKPDTPRNQVRFLHIVYPRKGNMANGGPKSVAAGLRDTLWRPTDLRAGVVLKQDQELKLTISTPDQIYHLELPPPGVGTGWIRITDLQGHTQLRRRPLPSGILPQGAPDSIHDVEYWNNLFDSRRAAIEWDKGEPALKLETAVQQGVIKPGRVVELGCGSGNDAVFLAKHGFEVTGIDISPTALSYAAMRAEEAGVHVNWVLADVLALPELGTFDFIFDRGCYHWVRYANAEAFVESLRQLSRPGTRCLILSLKGDGPGGVRETQMRADFSKLFEVERLEAGGIEKRGGEVSDSWTLLLERKAAE